MNSSQNHPHVLKMAPGRYAWCSCGNSKKQPFCDGTHESTGMRPLFIEIKDEQTIAWCGCKVSGKKPFCDGTHKKYAD